MGGCKSKQKYAPIAPDDGDSDDKEAACPTSQEPTAPPPPPPSYPETGTYNPGCFWVSDFDVDGAQEVLRRAQERERRERLKKQQLDFARAELIERALQYLEELKRSEGATGPRAPHLIAPKGASVIQAFICAGIIDPQSIGSDQLKNAGVLMAACERLRGKMSTAVSMSPKGRFLRRLIKQYDDAQRNPVSATGAVQQWAYVARAQINMGNDKIFSPHVVIGLARQLLELAEKEKDASVLDIDKHVVTSTPQGALCVIKA